jgi:hypothetical protein
MTDAGHEGSKSAPAVAWPDEVDAILTGDLTAALAYVTPAGGAVLSAVAPIGLRDRALGTVGFTTSRGFGRKLERIAADPRVALAYHARDHGRSRQPGLVVVQGTAAVEADTPELREKVKAQAVDHLGPIKTGRFWDRWLAVYYADRIGVTVTATRILWWPETRGAGEPVVLGSGLPAPPASQAPPAKGTAARVDVAREARRLTPVHRLLAWRGGDGYPAVVALDAIHSGPDALVLDTPSAIVPMGARRAAVLTHDYRPELVGLRSRYALGWLDAGAAPPDPLRFAPHTAGGFVAPPNKTLLLLVNGYLARRNLKRAQAAESG